MMLQCPHALACPMAQKSWCHFVQRIQRLPILKHSKSRVRPDSNWFIFFQYEIT
jgi:ribosomal protein RSM22 (predicted rRNA methylase)